MQQLMIDGGGKRKTILFRPDVPTVLKPQISETRIIAGERFYVCTSGKMYHADVFDRVWGVVIKILKKKRSFKVGKGRGRRVAA